MGKIEHYLIYSIAGATSGSILFSLGKNIYMRKQTSLEWSVKNPGVFFGLMIGLARTYDCRLICY